MINDEGRMMKDASVIYLESFTFYPKNIRNEHTKL